MSKIEDSWTSNQLDLCLNYLDPEGQRHNLFTSAAEKAGKVTFDRSFFRKREFQNRGTILVAKGALDNTLPGHETLFKEVAIATPQLSKRVKDYANDRTAERVKKPVLQTLGKILERDWDPDKEHICFHSSGYDSRILSGILMKLREKNGEGWIGKLLFLCLEPEGEYFRNIMKWEGWKENQIYVYQEGIGVDYKKELIDFKKVWRWVNSCFPPSHPFGPAVEKAKKRMTSDEIYVITAYGDLLYKWNKIRRKKAEKLRRKGCYLIGKWDYMNPLAAQVFYNIYYCFHTAPIFSAIENERFKIKFPYFDVEIASSWTNKREHVKEISPELEALPKFSEEAQQKYPYWVKSDSRLSLKTREEAAKNFSDSWFAKTTGRETDLAPEIGQKSLQWWSLYVVASICQRLIDQDVKIRI